MQKNAKGLRKRRLVDGKALKMFGEENILILVFFLCKKLLCFEFFFIKTLKAIRIRKISLKVVKFVFFFVKNFVLNFHKSFKLF